MFANDWTGKLLQLAKAGKGSPALKDHLNALGDKDVPADKARAIAGIKQLDVVKQSIPAMYLLDALANDNGVDDVFISYTSHFLAICSTDIRKFGKRFVRLCSRFQKQTQLAGRPDFAIGPLIFAKSKLDESANLISPIHALIFQSCLLAQNYMPALPMLHPEVCEINPTINKLTMRDFLLFCYYGARIHIGRRNYKEALDLLLQALTAPTLLANAITMAAYKKYVLVSLIHLGKCPELPQYTPQAVIRAARAHCSDYKTLAEESAKGNIEQFQNPQNAVREVCKRDKNEALLDLGLQYQTKREILRLTETYMTMSMDQISHAIQKTPLQTELTLLRMIQAGEVCAKIDDEQGLVSFAEDLSDIQLSTMAQRIESQIQQTLVLSERIKEMDHQVSCEKAYQAKANKAAPVLEDAALRQGIEASLADQA